MIHSSNIKLLLSATKKMVDWLSLVPLMVPPA